MNTIHVYTLNKKLGVPDFGNIGIDTIVEVPDNGEYAMVIQEMTKRAYARCQQIKADLVTWSQTYTLTCQGPALCFCFQTPGNEEETKLIEEFCRTDSNYPGPPPLRHLELDSHLVPQQQVSSSDFIINYRWDYGIKE